MYLITSYQKENNPDFIADFTLCILWSEIEANVAMIVCCMPTLGPVIGKCRDCLGPYLRSTPFSRWLISLDRSKLSNDTELMDASKMKSFPSRGPSHYRGAWIEVPGTVSAAGFSDTERLDPSEGILARTEISTTYGPAYEIHPR